MKAVRWTTQRPGEPVVVTVYKSSKIEKYLTGGVA